MLLVRIVSLLPSATEIAFALRLGDELVGVSAECDHPDEARSGPVVTRSQLPEGLDAAEIDRAVREATADGHQLYVVDEDQLRALDPDLVITQDTCAVCAVDSPNVVRSLQQAGIDAEVLSLDPGRLEEVLTTIETVGRATGREPEALALTTRLHGRLAEVADAVAGTNQPSVFVLEWADPPFASGHWVPDLVSAAGGTPVVGRAGEPSRRVAWESVAENGPDVVLVAPCGFDLDAALAQAREAPVQERLADVSDEVWAIDADALVVRPGPRLVDGVETIAAILHPEVCGPPDPARAQPVATR